MLWRIGLFYCAAPLSGAFGGLLATGLARIHTSAYNGWPFIFFVEVMSFRDCLFVASLNDPKGALTVVFGLVAVFFLPNTPSDTTFLSSQEATAAVQRMKADSQGSSSNEVEAEKFDWHWVKLAVFDVNTILLSMIFFFIITPIYSFSLFLPTINSTFGYTRVVSQLLTVRQNPHSVAKSLKTNDHTGPPEHRGLLQRPSHLLGLRPL